MRSPLLHALVLSAVTAAGVTAQTPVAPRREPLASVSGIVRDSIAARVLTGAVVQLVAAEGTGDFAQSATSDSLGRFSVADVPDGRYTIGFFHPMLDSLGLEPPTREITVSAHKSVRADLAIPAASRLRAAICGAREANANVTDSGAVIVGFVRDGRDRSAVGKATVVAQWTEMSFTASGISRHTPRLLANSVSSGWYALCDVPGGGLLTLVASRGADSTGYLEIEMPRSGFLRRDLYIGPPTVLSGVARTTPRDTAGADTAAVAARRVRSGDGRLAGRVVRAAGGAPIAGAVVTVTEGPQARANDRGDFMVMSAPIGTRMVEVRAVGYSPERVVADVVTGAGALRVDLLTLQAVLDTVRVRAQRSFDRHNSGFEQRRRTMGMGRFLGVDDIARRMPVVTSDLFKTVPGMRVYPSADGGNTVLLRGAFGDACAPIIYLDGAYMGELAGDEIDNAVKPSAIAAIEVYPGGTEPPQFNRGMAGSGCGSVVIWTK